MTSYDIGPESLLGIPDEQTASDLHDKLDLALQYIANWYKATKGSDNQNVWWQKIDATRAKVENAEKLMDPNKIFPGNKELAAYNDAASSFINTYHDLQFAPETLPQPGLIDTAADVVDTVFETPGYLAGKVATAIGDVAGAAGQAAGSAVRNFIYAAWPALVVAVILLVGYIAWKVYA